MVDTKAISRIEVDLEEGTVSFEFAEFPAKKDLVRAVNEAYEILKRLSGKEPREIQINREMETAILSFGHDEIGDYSFELLREGAELLYRNGIFGLKCRPLEGNSSKPVIRFI